jgi:hypothetical protein
MSKKPSLAAATPNNREANAFLDDDAHDFLTRKMTDQDSANATLVVGVLRTVEAGGHDVNGDRITKTRLDHLEIAYTGKDEEDVIKILKRLAKGRTGSTALEALDPPAPTLDMPDGDDGDPDDEVE